MSYSYPDREKPTPPMPPPRPAECCARCRRGTKNHGELMCGYSMDCKCHGKGIE